MMVVYHAMIGQDNTGMYTTLEKAKEALDAYVRTNYAQDFIDDEWNSSAWDPLSVVQWVRRRPKKYPVAWIIEYTLDTPID